MKIEMKNDEKKIVARNGSEQVAIEPWGENVIRVRAGVAGPVRDDLPGCALPAGSSSAVLMDNDEYFSIRNGILEARIEKEYGRISFYRCSDNSILLEEVISHPAAPSLYPLGRDYRAAGGDLFRLDVRFQSKDGEKFYGLGQHRHGLFNQKGAVVELAQRNAEVCIPFMISNRGYGFLWHNPGVGRVELAENWTHWVADAASQIDYFVFAGDDYSSIMNSYVDVTGHSPMLPDYAAGFWQCKLRYRTQEQLMGVAREHKRRGLPLSIIVVDFFHWENQGDWDWDPRCWPDPAGMIRELKEMGIELMVSVWPTATAHSRNYKEMFDNGYFIRTERGLNLIQIFTDVPVFPRREDLFYYDSTNPEARAFLMEQIRKNYYDIGCRVFWLDACEPEMTLLHHDNMRFHLGQGQAVANIYPYCHQQGFWEGLKAAGEKEIITLCRSAWAGSQRFGAAVWSGDIPSSWDMFKRSVPAGLNIMMSGIPWWTTDIGGFADGEPEDPSFRELLVRWFQFGAFCPLFRLHGVRNPTDDSVVTGGPNEVWSFGDEAYGIMRDYLFLRERIRPYVMDQMRLASEKGTPPMRPLWFDFAHDSVCWDIANEYLFGPDLLVAPVMEYGARQREVYLPQGAVWTNAWTGEKITGGQTVVIDAPIEQIPLFFRDEARLRIVSE
jgi:alpha-D-xyloside xylohydrolase